MSVQLEATGNKGSRTISLSRMSSSIHIVFDEAALEALFKEQFKSLCAYCQSRFGFEIDEAKEVVHTSFPTGMKD
jgi:hypothetical protein